MADQALQDALDQEAEREGAARSRFYRCTGRARIALSNLGGEEAQRGRYKQPFYNGSGGARPMRRPGSGGFEPYKKYAA